MPVGESREGNTIFRGGDICWRRDVVGEAAVLVEVDDDETAQLQQLVAKVTVRGSSGSLHVVPVLRLPDGIIEMFEHQFASSHITRRVKRVHRAAFWIVI